MSVENKELETVRQQLAKLVDRVNELEQKLNSSTTQTIAIVAGTLLGSGQFSDNQIGPALQRAAAIVKQTGL